MPNLIRLSTAAAVAALAVSASGQAFAQTSVLKECGAQYQAAKAANQLNGQSWQEYLKACRARIAEPAAAPAPAPAPAPAATPAPEPTPAPAPAKTPAPAEAPTPAPAPSAAAPAPAKPAAESLREREKQCGAEWKSQKAELRKTDPKITWPKFWHECNVRLKAQSQ